MTPARLWRERVPPAARRLLAAAICAALLALLFIPARDPATHGLTIDWRPSAVLAGLLFLLAVLAVVRPQAVAGRGLARVLTGLAVAAALFNLVDAATPTLLGRDLDLYWDFRHTPSLVGLAVNSGGLWRVVGAAFVLLAAIAILAACAYRLWRVVLGALTDRRVAVGAALVLGLALNAVAWLPAAEQPLATGLGRAAIRQASGLRRAWEKPATLPAALSAPGPPGSDLAGLKRRDVYLVYIESYGTTVFDTPDFRAALEGPLAQFQTAAEAAGYTIASNRLVSPTFGGGSWLAHATMASGIRLNDPVLYAALMTSGRKLLPGYFKDAGWRAIDIMPGIKGRYPEGRAWGFDREVFADGLGYHGPAFGWFQIPTSSPWSAPGRSAGRSARSRRSSPRSSSCRAISRSRRCRPTSRTGAIRHLRHRAPSGMGGDLPSARMDPARPRLCAEPRIRLRRAAGVARPPPAGRCADHSARRPSAAGRGRRRGPALDRTDPRAIARSGPNRAVSRPRLCPRHQSHAGCTPPGHGGVSRPLPRRL